MKKSILFFLAAALLTGGALTAGSFAKDTSNALFNANVEALTQNEGSTRTFTCHDDFFYREGYTIRDCETCTMLDDHKASFWALPDLCVDK